MRIDLHRHIGGSIRPSTIYEIIQKQQRVHRIITEEEVTKSMMISPTEGLTFQNFLRKFQIFEAVHWDEWAITQSLKQVVYDIAHEQIEYCELKFTIDKYVKYTNWSDVDVIKFIHKVVQEEAAKWDIFIGLVLAVKYEADRERQKQITSLISNAEVAERVVGLDLVGDEQFFDVDFYAPIFDEWRRAGKGLEAHVGETVSAENVRLAIERLGVKRIAHGIKAAISPDILALAKERDVCFDIAITSNVLTGQVPSYDTHPVGRILEAGVPVTIGTDDPAILGIDLDHEYMRLQKHFNLDDEKLMDVMENSYKYAFIDWKTIRE